ncbi:MAG: hypothetical protein HXY30_06465 [Pseudorhodoplanes sp.]|nr:hypothetical protein [Pseudorhodoplanes sp.]
MSDQRGLLLFMTDVNPALEEEFNRWYEKEHLPERMAVPGFLNARRFRCVEGPGPKFLALYDLESAEVLRSEPYLRIMGANKSPWTLRMEANFANARRNVYTMISERKR